MLETAFWIILWRPPTLVQAREIRRALEAGQPFGDLLKRLLVSGEFRLLLEAVRRNADTGRNTGVVHEGLQALGDDREFVTSAFRLLLDREPDAGGRAFYEGRLAQGELRLSVLKSLLCCEEFHDRYRRIAPQVGFVPRDSQLCELANPAKWDNPEWMALLESLEAVPADKPSMHRKAYEFTQLLFGLTRLGQLHGAAEILSVGAGHEPVLYWLANRVRRVVATDLYAGAWQSEGAMEGDAGVLADPAAFAPFDYPRERLVFLPMAGQALAFPAGQFDSVYSLSSVEHFGGLAGARAAVAEMARVLKPGGVLALATEYVLSGPPHHEAFLPAQVRALIEHPLLALVEPVDERVWCRYEHVAVDLRANPHQTPHMVVTDLGTVFTSVMLFLRRK